MRALFHPPPHPAKNAPLRLFFSQPFVHSCLQSDTICVCIGPFDRDSVRQIDCTVCRVERERETLNMNKTNKQKLGQRVCLACGRAVTLATFARPTQLGVSLKVKRPTAVKCGAACEQQLRLESFNPSRTTPGMTFLMPWKLF